MWRVSPVVSLRLAMWIGSVIWRRSGVWWSRSMSASAPRSRWWPRVLAAMPLRFALLATTAVWAMGCVWSFREQALFAQAKGFGLPWLLPAVIDGLAIALACVAYAASLDGRPGTMK